MINVLATPLPIHKVASKISIKIAEIIEFCARTENKTAFNHSRHCVLHGSLNYLDNPFTPKTDAHIKMQTSTEQEMSIKIAIALNVISLDGIQVLIL